MSKEPIIKFSNEESKANLRYKVGQNLINLIDLTKSTIKSSETNELFRNCLKNFVANESLIENTCEKLKKIDIISTQLNYQVDAINKDCQLIQEVCKQIDSIQKVKA
jgi:hypothetical protein